MISYNVIRHGDIIHDIVQIIMYFLWYHTFCIWYPTWYCTWYSPKNNDVVYDIMYDIMFGIIYVAWYYIWYHIWYHICWMSGVDWSQPCPIDHGPIQLITVLSNYNSSWYNTWYHVWYLTFCMISYIMCDIILLPVISASSLYKEGEAGACELGIRHCSPYTLGCCS